MALFKTYLDDSGDPSCTVLTISGYLADVDGWRHFENVWQATLDQFEVPYFHMKEFGNPNGIYRHIKSDPVKEASFIVGLIDAIHDGGIEFCPFGGVRLSELAEFNNKHGLSLDPYALLIYGCLKEIRADYRNDDIDVVVDRFDRSPSRVGLAFEYLRTDRDYPADTWDQFTPIPVQKHESFRNVRPLQAADLIAWEMRKAYEDRRDWNFPEDRDSFRAITESYQRFVEIYQVKYGREPRVRKSFTRLRRSPVLTPKGYIWDRVLLEQAHRLHPNGWTLA